MPSSPDLIVLKDGVPVERALLSRLWALEGAGFRFSVEDGQLIVRPGSRLTPEDRELIRAHRETIRHLLSYEVSG